jgi:cell division protein FtsN
MARIKYSKKKKGDGIGFKFLIVSLLIIMFVIFVIGLQIGRVVEKTSRESRGSRVVTRTFDEEDIGERIRGEIERMRESPKENSSDRGRVPSAVPGQQKGSAQRDKKQSTEEKKPASIDLSRKRDEQRKTDVRREMLYLQVGVFSVEKNAESMKRRLEKYGLKVKLETFKQRKGGVLRRVLVGPFLTAAELTKERGKIERLTGIKPVLVRREG